MKRHYFSNQYKGINICGRSRQRYRPVVTVSNGKLRGKTKRMANNDLYYSFQGIPYAKPPLGSLRFKDPQPAESWTGIRDATHEGNDCTSKHFVMRTMIGSEDCLSLNVYTTNLPNESNYVFKPVMFWIHGGGFTSGSGSTEIYGPEFLLTEDVVLVTVNYRTGVLGFLSLDDPDLEVPGNAGLKDIVMALKWVRENIRHFSGDPNNVTLFGQSAGAAASHYLMLSPMARGLFHKVILQSGCSINLWAKGRRYIEELAEVLEIKGADERKILKVLQKMSVAQLFRLIESVQKPFFISSVRIHGPVVERKHSGAFLTEHPLDIIKSGKYNHVPVMIGYTTREGILGEIIMKRHHPFRPITDFELSVPHFFQVKQGSDKSKMIAERIKKFYFGEEEPSTRNRDNWKVIISS